MSHSEWTPTSQDHGGRQGVAVNTTGRKRFNSSTKVIRSNPTPVLSTLCMHVRVHVRTYVCMTSEPVRVKMSTYRRNCDVTEISNARFV